ncbi:MAG: His-Xaa-Ser system radical SAM maturase HxsC [Pseudomonadota bacterium]
MIALRVAAEADLAGEILVARLVISKRSDRQSQYGLDYRFERQIDNWSEFVREGLRIRLEASAQDLDGDVILLAPRAQSAHRLIRAKSHHNSLLITEQCDQLCVMCSQPPKPHHVDLFAAFLRACLVSPQNTVIGVTGGEPLLHKDQLFALLKEVHSERPDIRFHVLTNGQHFTCEDISILNEQAFRNVLWAIPFYAPNPSVHDHIVGKPGAFERLLETFEILSRTTAQIELRTVVMRSNNPLLAQLADFLTTHIPFASCWSIMQMERIGYGRMNWDQEFLDTSVDFEEIARSLCIAHTRGLEARLFNFPLCTVPKPYRRFAVASISDWKMKFEKFCIGCSLRSRCGGFFKWHDQKSGYARIGMNEEA